MRALLLLAFLAVAQPARADESPRLRFGIQTPNQNITWEELRDTWKEAESLGFDSAWPWCSGYGCRRAIDADSTRFYGCNRRRG